MRSASAHGVLLLALALASCRDDSTGTPTHTSSRARPSRRTGAACTFIASTARGTSAGPTFGCRSGPVSRIPGDHRTAWDPA